MSVKKTIVGLKKTIDHFSNTRLQRLWISKRSNLDNIYYCCVQKTASQWLRQVLNDAIIYRHTGMEIEPYKYLGLKTAGTISRFPVNSIVTHLYIDYETYVKIPKPSNYLTFFVNRDPRDAVVSWYFSAKYSHSLVHPIPDMRGHLEKMDRTFGFKYVIDKLIEFGYFDSQQSWIDSGEKIFQYELLSKDYSVFLRELFQFLNIQLSDRNFHSICRRYKFERLVKRKKGVENKYSHYRKGILGDWKNYFNSEIENHFYEKTNSLVNILGYE